MSVENTDTYIKISFVRSRCHYAPVLHWQSYVGAGPDLQVPALPCESLQLPLQLPDIGQDLRAP